MELTKLTNGVGIWWPWSHDQVPNGPGWVQRDRRCFIHPPHHWVSLR